MQRIGSWLASETCLQLLICIFCLLKNGTEPLIFFPLVSLFQSFSSPPVALLSRCFAVALFTLFKILPLCFPQQYPVFSLFFLLSSLLCIRPPFFSPPPLSLLFSTLLLPLHTSFSPVSFLFLCSVLLSLVLAQWREEAVGRPS